jgi:lipopolysaccharide/colanic/teichoic acid biosynthesis glycosyltransferase
VSLRTRAALGVKRLVDLVGAVVALVLLSPILAWAALAVLVSQGPPILFRHQRPGRDDRTFTLVKFRTMRGLRPGEARYHSDEQRVTRLGRILRSTSIDELPELWNVLRGDMSLVGPRPLLVEYLATYTPEERRRHEMRPGITSWAAVNGRHVLKFHERLALDTWYVDHWSLALDARIIGMTLVQVLGRRDVAATQDIGEIGFPLPSIDLAPLPGSVGDRPTPGDGATSTAPDAPIS